MLKVFKYLFLLCIPVFTEGQVYLSGMSSNPVIKSYLKNVPEIPAYKSTIRTYEAIELPFEDNFTYNGVYPDTNKWTDNTAYINSHYPIRPVDRGVATFDVLDANGTIYSQASVFPFIADYLTSFPIRLDSVFHADPDTSWKITTADSVYLSFYYQPQGRGDAPLPYDSLVLEFGHYTGDTVFSHVEYFWLMINTLTNSLGLPFGEGDTIFPGDTIYYSGCDFSFVLPADVYIYTDSINIPCDSVYILKTTWENVWSVRGYEIDSFLIQNNDYFKRVMIPISDTLWYRNDFQFRFYNYGSLSAINSWKSNTDHWHIDRVYLNAGRSVNDIYTRKIKFIEPALSLLKAYSSLPVYQYVPSMIKDSIIVYANNTDSIDHQSHYNYTVQDEEGILLPEFNYPGFTGIIEDFFSQDINSYKPFAVVPVVAPFNPVNDEVEYTITHTIYDIEDPTIGDTITFKQKFGNYFAYDDGTAERSYGASSDNTMIAVQFKTQQPDTLRGVQICFNKTQGNYNDRLFHIGVWNDNNGKPGSIIHELENRKPDFKDVNEFSTYIFDEIIRLGVYVFYVGVTQTTFDNLNIGFDRNTNSKNKTFYNTGGTWIPSPFDGSLMIRPILGRALTEPEAKPKSLPDDLEIHPNPPGNYSFVTLTLPVGFSNPDYKKYLTVRVFDICGKLIYSAPFEDNLNVAGFKNGFYIIDIFDAAYTKHYTAKLLIRK